MFDPQHSDQTQLATNFTVAQSHAACAARDRDTIAEALCRRFMERYIQPVTPMKGKEVHGFTKMAISCLMIESLESFRQGWENSNGKSALAFCYFFDSQRQFDSLRGRCPDFYAHVRCGILHQAETTGGWRITRKKGAPLFDATSITINAELFLQHLSAALKDFSEGLKTADWNSIEWKKVRRKTKALCANCQI